MRKSVICAALAALLVAGPAAADNKERWAFIKYDEIALLYYGIPESEAGTLYFSCNIEKKTIHIITPVMPRKAGKGATGKLKLINNASSLEYAGKVVGAGEDDGIQVEAATTIDPKIFALVETGKSLTIDSFGKKETIPLKNVTGPLAKMRMACR
jgi:hypothetical protein